MKISYLKKTVSTIFIIFVFFFVENIMLITGIRQRLNSEFNARRSASVTRYLLHYLQMFAILGVIFPVLVGVDFFLDSKPSVEIVRDKYYKLMDHLNQIEYSIFTDSYHFHSDHIFYEHTNKDDAITLHRAPIFQTVTSVTSRSGQNVYTYKPDNIYGWILIIVFLTFVCSVILLIKTRNRIKKREFLGYDSMINLGIFNAIICLITIVASMFQILY